jgi:hypothetical protein
MPSNYTISATSYSWVEIAHQAGAILVVGSGNHWAAAIDLGANVLNLYGTTYTGNNQLFASTHGLLTFLSGFYNGAPNGDLINSTSQAAISPLWNDYYQNNPPNDMLWSWIDTANNRIIVEWNQVLQMPSGAVPWTFEAILQLNTGATPGNIIFQYKQLDSFKAAQSSIGIKDVGSPATSYLVSSVNASNPLVDVNQAMIFTWGTPDNNQSLADTVTFGSTETPLPDISQSLADTVNFSEFYSAVPAQSLQDTVTFSVIHAGVVESAGAYADTVSFSSRQDVTEYNVHLTDIVRFGGGVRIDTGDLANGRYRY